MPFTLSHPAAVIPLYRRGLVLSALIIGSMSPDFEYFLRLQTGHRFSHSLPGLFLFCIPTGLLALWIFHSLLKLPLLSLLPLSHQQRLLPVAKTFRFGPARQFGLIVFSLLLGACTHLVWDAFTHEESGVLHYLPLLRTPIAASTSPDPLKPCDLLQHGSSIFGLLLLGYWYRRWLRQAVPQPIQPTIELSRRAKLILGGTIGSSACFLASIYGLSLIPFGIQLSWLTFFLRQAVLVGMLAFSLELMLFSVCWHLIAEEEWRLLPQAE